MLPEKQPDRNYWLWVTRPEYYLDDDGNDREDLDPANGKSTGGWWTCHKDTQRGDLILLYRTTPKRDFGYLIQAESDAYSILDDGYASRQGWEYGCDYQVLYKFSDPVTLANLRDDERLDNWGPLRAQFRRKVYRVLDDDWKRITELAAKKETDFTEFVGDVSQQTVAPAILREEQLEDAIAGNLALLAPFGFDLELYIDPETGQTGRQLVCKGDGGRIDLLCYDRRNAQYVVIELKNVRAGRSAFAQICSYIGWVEERIALDCPVVGIVISRGTDAKFDSARKVTDCLHQINLTELGFE